jgi:hypothetical protein
MESFKIENFQRHNAGADFPWFETLLPHECASLKTRLVDRLGLVTSTDSLPLVQRLNDISSVVRVFSPVGAVLDLAAIFHSLGITPSATVLINWYRFDQIDRMKFSDLCHNLEDVWYPAADDIDIFDTSLHWIISLTHYGKIRIVRLNGKGSHPCP